MFLPACISLETAVKFTQRNDDPTPSEKVTENPQTLKKKNRKKAVLFSLTSLTGEQKLFNVTVPPS